MNDGPAVGETESRPIYRRRPGRPLRILLILSGVALTALIGAAARRAWGIAGVPNAPEPFDVATSTALPVLAPGTDAFPILVAAKAKLGPAINPFAPAMAARNGEWSAASDPAKAWIRKHRRTLEMARVATDRPDVSPTIPGQPEARAHEFVVNDMPLWSHVLLLEAGRHEAEGDQVGAWPWHRARLRLALMMGKRGTHHERRNGSWQFSQAVSRVKRWADHPDLTVPTLRAALADLDGMAGLHSPLSDGLKVEYRRLMEELVDPETIYVQSEPLLNAPPPGGATPPAVTTGRFEAPEPLRPLARRVDWWLSGEPERSRRVIRHVFANWLAQADRPAALRSKVVFTNPLIFDADPGETPPIPPADLARLASSAPLFTLLRGGFSNAWSFHFTLDQWPTSLSADRRARAELIVSLAGRIFEIETGAFPASDDALVPKVLPRLPGDYVPPDGGDVQIVTPPKSEAP